MSESPFLDNGTNIESSPPPERDSFDAQTTEQPIDGFEHFWQQVILADLKEPVLRIGTHLLSILFIILVIWTMHFLTSATNSPKKSSQVGALAAPFPTKTPTSVPPDLVPYDTSNGVSHELGGVFRAVNIHTMIPSRPRVNVITYTVQTGDTVFGIAEQFGLKPETILWGNYNVLADNPHRLQPGQILNILPVDGTYHKWSAGEDFRKVAEYYGVDPEAVIEWAGNPIDQYTFDMENPDIKPGTMLIIPGGKREYVDYSPPRIPRDNPAVARTYGPGYCGVVSDGAIGSGSFIWPTIEHYLSGYDYDPSANHPAIDIAGNIGNPVWAVDDGVVVYSGWSNFGYGNLIVLDHGNGWQSLYAHLNEIYTVCGQSISQGTRIGSIGTTGNSTGSHLHFELIYENIKVNPWDFLP